MKNSDRDVTTRKSKLVEKQPDFYKADGSYRIYANISKETYEAVQDFSFIKRTTMSDCVEQMLKYYLENNKERLEAFREIME